MAPLCAAWLGILGGDHAMPGVITCGAGDVVAVVPHTPPVQAGHPHHVGGAGHQAAQQEGPVQGEHLLNTLFVLIIIVSSSMANNAAGQGGFFCQGYQPVQHTVGRASLPHSDGQGGGVGGGVDDVCVVREGEGVVGGIIVSRGGRICVG